MKSSFAKFRSVALGLLATVALASCTSGSLPEKPVVGEAIPTMEQGAGESDGEIAPQGNPPSSEAPVAAADQPSTPDLPPSDDAAPSDNTPPAGLDIGKSDIPSQPSNEGSLAGRLKGLPEYLDKAVDSGLGTLPGDLYVENWFKLLHDADSTSKDANGANMGQRCNTFSPDDKGAGKVMTAFKIGVGAYVTSVGVGCEDVGSTEDPSVAPEMKDPKPDQEGVDATVKAPLGFAFSGYAVRTCNYDGHKFVAGLQPLAKRIETWGVNDDIEWQGPKFQDPKTSLAQTLDPRCSDWVYERCEDGFLLTGVAQKTSTVTAPLPGMKSQEFLGSLFGMCQPVKSKTQSKPAVGEITFEKTVIKNTAGTGAICKQTCPAGSIVVGLRYAQSDQDRDGSVLTRVALICKNLKDQTLAESGSCGEDFFIDATLTEHRTRMSEFVNRIELFPGFGIHAIHAWTTYVQDRSDIALDKLRFDQTPVDLYRKNNTVWTGAQGEFSFSSAKAGGDGGAEKILSCSGNQIVTGASFRISDAIYNVVPINGELPHKETHRVVTGIGDLECAQVNVDLK